jgi:L-alanine-DL-glutamate epimerase-like enolase superfamily enzyme
MPIAAGESEATRFDFRDLAMLKAVPIFFSRIRHFAAALTEAMRISALASAFNLPICSASLGGGALLLLGLASLRGFALEFRHRIFARRQSDDP